MRKAEMNFNRFAENREMGEAETKKNCSNFSSSIIYSCHCGTGSTLVVVLIAVYIFIFYTVDLKCKFVN